MSENTGSVKEEPQTTNVKEIIEVLSTEPETPMLDQESPTNKFFILQDFWPVFKFFQILGGFPCKKETDEKGGIQLQQIRWWILAIKLFGWLTLLIPPKELLFRHLISSSKEASDYFNNDLFARYSSNSARFYVSQLFLPLAFVLVFSCFLSFVIKRKELCALQAISSSPLNDTAKKGTNTVRKARIYFILMATLALISLVSPLLSVYLPLIKLLTTNASIVLTIIIAFLDAMFNLCGFSITINTVILYIPAIDL